MPFVTFSHSFLMPRLEVLDQLLQPMRTHLKTWAEDPSGQQRLRKMQAVGASLGTFHLLLQGMLQMHRPSSHSKCAAPEDGIYHSDHADDDSDMIISTPPADGGVGPTAANDVVTWLGDLLLTELWPGSAQVLQAALSSTSSPSSPSCGPTAAPSGTAASLNGVPSPMMIMPPSLLVAAVMEPLSGSLSLLIRATPGCCSMSSSHPTGRGLLPEVLEFMASWMLR